MVNNIVWDLMQIIKVLFETPWNAFKGSSLWMQFLGETLDSDHMPLTLRHLSPNVLFLVAIEMPTVPDFLF